MSMIRLKHEIKLEILGFFTYLPTHHPTHTHIPSIKSTYQTFIDSLGKFKNLNVDVFLLISRHDYIIPYKHYSKNQLKECKHLRICKTIPQVFT